MQDKGFIERREHVLKTALRVTSTDGWANVTVRDLCAEAQISLADFYDLFDDKTDILVYYGRHLDRKVMESFPSFHPETAHRERLFDILMERFDLANQDRTALLSILNSMKSDPKQMVISLPHLGLSMSRMLELAGIDTDGIRGAIRVAGMIGIYAWILRTWMEDETPDLSKTMASLDKSLARIDEWAKNYNL